jgi:hypothetical protein
MAGLRSAPLPPESVGPPGQARAGQQCVTAGLVALPEFLALLA